GRLGAHRTEPLRLLRDEPTTGLDPRSRLEVQEFIGELRDTHDATILLCTHDLAEAEALADRVGIIDRGLLQQLEPPARLKAGYGVESLEQAFFAATGRVLADDTEDGNDGNDDERDVFA